ncbi:hypothetical protein DYU05_18645 [Mucilaginibacter terrenus]|uniref:Glycosyltransferase RgtA/B/C/D-like domain-containing protein n=1 Tax=Mucilaginibacter terrenus TaxID=2482727 RepID=A0A3E2NLQ8_9SPHI|nr:glycosyltransferase family 39 protein [Mucilaginibacter terrenus]RFZ81840.1 hypothetical protein DYU05_18645 [Mucilaginibacter terrenus]
MPKNLILLVVTFSVAKICIHLVANCNYGLHADELYYIALSKHLQWGYLDTSPLIAFVARFSSVCFGDSAFAFRIIPTLVSGCTVFMTGLTAYHLGGKRLAITIACMAVICSPALLATSYFLQPVVFEHFFWTLGAFLIIRYMQTSRPVFLFAFAVVIAFGILNKYTILIYFFAIILGIIISGRLKGILNKEVILSALLCLLIIAPNLLWQIMNHFPAVQYIGIVKESVMNNGLKISLIPFLFFNGGGLAVWLAGIGFFLFSKPHKSYSFIAWTLVITTVLLIVLQGKIYYVLGAFPAVFAAGGICWEKILKGRNFAWRVGLAASLILPAVIALPAVIPVLPFKTALRYFRLMRTYSDVTAPLTWDDGRVHDIPQTYADMLGWEDVAAKVKQAALLLNPQQQRGAVILTEDYGLTGALAFYNRSGVPVISPNNSFMLWSPGTLNAENIIYVTDKPISEVSLPANEVTLIGKLNNRFAHHYGCGIYLLRKPSALFKLSYRRQREKFL